MNIRLCYILHSLSIQIVLGKNACTSRWVDILELAQAQDIEVVNNNGDFVTDEFIAAMEQYQARDPTSSAGIVWRWLIGHRGRSNTLYLMVQALPCSLSKIKSTPELREEHTKGVIVDFHPIDYTVFENTVTPTPMLFSEQPEETNRQFKSSPEYAYNCLMSLAERLLLVGEISRYYKQFFTQ